MKWTENDIALLNNLAEKGLTTKEMCESELNKFGIDAIRAKLSKLNIKYNVIYKLWTNEENDKLLELIKLKYTVEQIQTEIPNRSKDSIINRIVDFGFEPQSDYMKQKFKNIEDIKNLAAIGKNRNEISKILNIPFSKVSGFCLRHNIETRLGYFCSLETEQSILVELKKRDKSFKAVARLIKVSPTMVEKIARENNIKSDRTIRKEKKAEFIKNGLQQCDKCKQTFMIKDDMFHPKMNNCKECEKKRLKIKLDKLKYISDVDKIINRKLSACRGTSVKRNREFNLEFQDVLNMLEQQNYRCYYSGIKMEALIFSRGKINKSISIDRINSSKGYTKDNVVLCCAFINIMKMNLPKDDFIEYCRIIANNHKI